jgi:proteic killer suppression protein
MLCGVNNKSYYVLWELLTFGVSITNSVMIISFGSKETEKIWGGDRVKKLPLEIQEIGRRKLRMLNNSQSIFDLKIPPSNRLEKLKGDWKDYYSIGINDQWRIVFKWNNGNAENVDIIDYH